MHDVYSKPMILDYMMFTSMKHMYAHFQFKSFAHMMFISTMHMHDRGFSKYFDVSTTLRLRKDMNSKISQGKTLKTRVSHIRGFVLSGSTEQGCWQPPFATIS